MEKRQAIEFLEYLRQDRNLEGTIYGDALNMAIEALKAQLFSEDTTSDTISRTEVVEHLRRMLEATVPNTDYDEGFVDGVEFGVSTVSTMPTVQPVATDTNVGNNSEIPNSSDTVSRQAAIDALQKCRKHCIDPFDSYHIDIQDAENQLSKLPTVQPEPKEGKWVYGEDSTADCVDGYRCSQCGFFVPWDYNHKFIDYINDYAYCPNCGARMKGERQK